MRCGVVVTGPFSQAVPSARNRQRLAGHAPQLCVRLAVRRGVDRHLDDGDPGRVRRQRLTGRGTRLGQDMAYAVCSAQCPEVGSRRRAEEAVEVGAALGGPVLEGAEDPTAPVVGDEDGEVRSEFEPTETLEVVLARYAEVAARTEDVVRSLPDLDVAHELPVTPWWPEGGSWSARRALLHLLAETAQHAGHADLLRESLDGQKSMG